MHLHLKAPKRDDFLRHRACQLQRIALPRPSWPRRRSAPPTAGRTASGGAKISVEYSRTHNSADRVVAAYRGVSL
jgi:hypothetical protein